MRRYNPFRSKIHHDSASRIKTTSTLNTNSRSFTTVNTDNSTPIQPRNISTPIINCSDKVVINDKDHRNEISNEEQTKIIENDNLEEQISILEEPERMSDEYNHTDDQPISSSSTSSNQSSLSTKKTEPTTPPTTTMVGNNPKEDILTSCKATAMIYNDAQKKWIHCATNGPAKIQLLFAPESQTYRIVGRQIQDHEVVLNHSISKGLKYNQATPTFHQWRDQSSVYGLNFPSKLDAQEFGTTMMKILESVNGSTNLSSQTNANGGVTLPSSTTTLNNNNNNSTTSSKRQINQPSSLLPSAATTVSINSTSTSSSVSEAQQQQQQQQQHSSSSYNNQLRPNSNTINSTPTSTNNNFYSQRYQPPEEDETNYALISDSYSTYGDNSTNKNNNIPQAPPLNTSMSNTGSAPPAAPPPPPPPPPPPFPNGFGSGPPPAPALILPTANGNGNGTNAVRKTSATTNAPQMDLMSEMAAKVAQRRKNIDGNEKSDSSNAANTAKGTTKASSGTTTNLPAAPVPPVQTSPRMPRKTSESHPIAQITSSDLEKLKTEILSEIRKDIEKAKQEILSALQKSAKK